MQKDANTAIKALADIDQEFAAAESFSDPVAHFYSALKQLKDDHRFALLLTNNLFPGEAPLRLLPLHLTL